MHLPPNRQQPLLHLHQCLQGPVLIHTTPLRRCKHLTVVLLHQLTLLHRRCNNKTLQDRQVPRPLVVHLQVFLLIFLLCFIKLLKDKQANLHHLHLAALTVSLPLTYQVFRLCRTTVNNLHISS